MQVTLEPWEQTPSTGLQYNTTQLDCLCVEKFAFWLAIYIKTFNKINNKTYPSFYDILPSTTAVFSYAIGPRKLSANEQFFVGAQTVVSLLQTTQIISDVCFITDHVAYASSNQIKIV